MSFLTKTILTVCVIAALLPTVTLSDEAPPSTKVQVKQEEVILSPVEYADKYTEQYGVDPKIFKKVMFCESSNNPNAIGDRGLARNVLQFHKQTFLAYEKRLGVDLEYDSYKDQIQLAAWMFSQGEQYNWSCYKIVTGK